MLRFIPPGCFSLVGTIMIQFFSLHVRLDAAQANGQPSVLSPSSFSAQAPQREANRTIRLPRVPGGLGYATDPAFSLRFAEPVGLCSPPGATNRLFVLEKPGRIIVMTNLAAPTRTVFLDISDRVFHEQECGLLGMAFHPGYATNRSFYITYTFSTNGVNSGIHLRLAAFQGSPGNPEAALADSELPLMTQYDGDPWHEGGDLHFGPDGYLYVSIGDGGQFGMENVQRIDRDFFGGILRIDVDRRPGNFPPNPHPGGVGPYAIPADNPFFGVTTFAGAPGDPNRVRTEFYAVGLRNPWRFSFDPMTGDLYSNDTGSSYREEINLVFKGGHYGWPFEEGSLALTNVVAAISKPAGLFPPMTEYGYESGGPGSGEAIGGGILYRGRSIPSLDGAYVFSDFWTGDIGLIRPTSSELLSALKSVQKQIEQLEGLRLATSSSLETQQAEWEKRWLQEDQAWVVLDPTAFEAGHGATLTKQPDRSLLAQGDLPWDDVYTVQARTELTNITAIRLELLLDDTLPNRGPGRSAGGNFVLTSFEVSAAPLDNSSASRSVSLRNPTADYSQSGWGIEQALDDRPETGWAISPAVGQNHQAVFEVEPPIRFPGGTVLTFALKQTLGHQATLGRFRISASTASPPLRADAAWSLAAVLRLAPESRSAEQKARLSGYYRSIDPQLRSIQEQIAILRQNQIASLNHQALPIEWIARVPGIASFGIHPDNGDLLMADMITGAIRRMSLQAGEVPSFPAHLDDAGIFSDVAAMKPEPGVVPYAVNVPFWSDHAVKTRWFCVPHPDHKIVFSREGHWSFPPGTVWIKHFELEITNGVPASARRLETRVLVLHLYGVHGATYRWDSTGRSASLVPDEGLNETILTYQGSAVRTQTWRYPSRAQCLQCHTAAGGYALGFNTVQLNVDVDYGDGPRNQIDLLSQAGYFQSPVTNLYTLPALSPSANTAISTEFRVRSYLHANCAQCHQPGGPGRSLWDARITTPRSLTGLIKGWPVHGASSAEDRLIMPGAPERSALFQRLANLDGRHMPPLGSSLPNPDAISLLGDWISNDLPSYETFPAWQKRHFASVTAPQADPMGDQDGDGFVNYVEYLTGTDPWRRSYGPRMSLERFGKRTYLKFTRLANLGFEVQWIRSALWTEDPFDFEPWETLNVPGNQVIYSASDTEVIIEDTSADSTMRFYRLGVREP